MSSITLEKIKGIGKITLNRPDVFNSFNREMAFALQAALDDCEKDEEIRVIYLTGTGKAFCAGQDLLEVTSPELNPGFKKILEEHYNPIIMKLRNIPLPVVCAVNGVAAGAGANIALACDIVVAHEKVKFIQAFSLIGLVPDSGGTYILPRLIGYQKAIALAMLGDRVSAIDAEKMGMIYRVFSDEEFADGSLSIAAKLAQMPTKGLAYTKHLFNQSLTNNLEQQLALEGEYQIKASETEDYHEGVTAFVEKRKPSFKGK